MENKETIVAESVQNVEYTLNTVGDSVLSFQYLCGFAKLNRLRVPSRALIILGIWYLSGPYFTAFQHFYKSKMNAELMVTYGYLLKKTISKSKSKRGKVVVLDKVFKHFYVNQFIPR